GFGSSAGSATGSSSTDSSTTAATAAASVSASASDVSVGTPPGRVSRYPGITVISSTAKPSKWRVRTDGWPSSSATLLRPSVAVSFTTPPPCPALLNSVRTDAGRSTEVTRQPGCQTPRFGGSVRVFGQLPVSGVGAGLGTRRHALDTLRDKLDLGLSDRLARQRP